MAMTDGAAGIGRIEFEGFERGRRPLSKGADTFTIAATR